MPLLWDSESEREREKAAQALDNQTLLEMFDNLENHKRYTRPHPNKQTHTQKINILATELTSLPKKYKNIKSQRV